MTSPNKEFKEKKEYKLVKYSFVINNENFIPSDLYSNMQKNGKTYVNLHTREERSNFFNELQEYNKKNEVKVKAKELSYEYFVRSQQKDIDDSYKTINFIDIVNYIKTQMKDDEVLKQLNSCFMVSNELKNFKVTVTSYDLVKKLNGDKMFLPYRKRQQIINVNTNVTQNNEMHQLG